MRKLRLLGFALASSLTLFSTVDGLAQAALPAGQSVWDHNGSAVRLSTEGVKRQFFYQNPRAGLQEVGVQPGTLLFDGRKNGNQYSGTAYIFSKSCGALPYVVTGPVSPDERTVTLSGKAPRINANCQVVGYRDDVLVFNYLSGSALVVAQGADREYDDYVRQWQGCLSTPQSDADLANSVALCNQALTFPRISPDDHAKLLQQRTALTVQQQQRLQKRTGDLDQQRSYQSYLDQFGPCVGSYNVNACERALQSPYATQDRENLLRSLKIGREQACRSGSLSACDVAAASPAASTVNQPASGVPTSIIIAGMIATLCAMALVVMFFRDRGAVPGGPPGRSRHQRIEFPIAAFSARIKSFIKGLAPFRHAHLAQTAHAKGGLSLEIAFAICPWCRQ